MTQSRIKEHTMPKKLIHVKQEHIDNGTQRSCTTCPIALAVAETIGSEQFVVGIASVVFHAGEEGREYGVPLPKRARSFIGSFDRGGPVQPFEFYLDVPA